MNMEYRVEEFLSYRLHMIKTDKFKTINMKIIFSQPIEKEKITICNFLADMLTTSSKKYPTPRELAIALQDLYAMNLTSSCRRFGKRYHLNIDASFLNEKYTEVGMFENCLEFLREIVFFPNIDCGEFAEGSFSIVRELMKDQIESVREDKKKLGLIKMLEAMGQDEAYSLHSFGYLEDLENINTKNLAEYYKEFIATSKIDIFILGDIHFDECKNKIMNLFRFPTVKMKKSEFDIVHSKIRRRPQEKEETWPINQDQISVGCKIEKLTDYEKNYILPIYNTILGGGSNSKLHMSVREKNSLCYYILSSCNKLDHILYIYAGIQNGSYKKTVELIKEAMKEMSKGTFTEEDIEKAKIRYITILDELQEDPFQIMSYYYAMDIFHVDPIEKRKQKISEVSYDELKKIGRKIHLDTIFLLRGDRHEEN